jgi:hypothetical protein
MAAGAKSKPKKRKYMAAHTNPNLTKQPNKHQTRKDKELQKEKKTARKKTKTPQKNLKTYPKKNQNQP